MAFIYSFQLPNQVKIYTHTLYTVYIYRLFFGMDVKGIIHFQDLNLESPTDKQFAGADPRCGERTLFDHG